MKVSIIIPTLNEARRIGATIQHLKKCSAPENIADIIVVDGGSSDETARVAGLAGARVVEASMRGRAFQCNEGASLARGSILYFVHADTRPPPGYDLSILSAVQAGFVAGSFRLIFDDPHPLLRTVAFFSRFTHPWCRAGDQSLFVLRRCFHSVGGYVTIPFAMEDVEIIPRLREKGRFVVLPGEIISSARRYREKGVFKLQVAYIAARVLDVQHYPAEMVARAIQRLGK